MAPGVADGVVVTHVHAVEAHHTARGIHHVVTEVDTLRLADVFACPAVGAAVGVYVEMEKRGIAEQAQRTAHRAHRVADYASVACRDKSGYGKKNNCNAYCEPGGYDHRHARYPFGHRVEQRGCHPAEYGVRVGPDDNCGHSGYAASCNECEPCVAETVGGVGITVRPAGALPGCKPVETCEAVLQRPQGTHRRAVDPSEQDGCAYPYNQSRYSTKKSHRDNLYGSGPVQCLRHTAPHAREKHSDNDQHCHAYNHAGPFQDAPGRKFSMWTGSFNRDVEYKDYVMSSQ